MATGVVPELSVVVVVFDLAREAPRTLHSLCADYQRYIAPEQFEIIVIDNGSHEPVDPDMLAPLAGNFRLIRIDDAPPSPAFAINCGLRAARGEIVGVMIDGARIATPGLLHAALHGARLYENAIVATLGWYLGNDFQSFAIEHGYDRKREDALLHSIEWPSDGYRLFEIGTIDESSVDGWFEPIAESNAVFARRAIWEKVGGVDERFDFPGGGLVNLDLLERLLEVEEARLVIPLAEATFHQMHGGTSTNATPETQVANFERWAKQYAEIRGRKWTHPPWREPTFIGTLPKEPLRRLVHSATRPVRADARPALGSGFRTDLWTDADVRIADDPAGRLVALGYEKFRDGQLAAASAVARVLAEARPTERGLDTILSISGPAVSATGPSVARRSEYHLALAQAYEILGDADVAETEFLAALAIEPDLPVAHLGLSRLRLPGPPYLWWLERIYATLEPKSILEIGVYEGSSLALARPPTIAIGVDPKPSVLVPLRAETHIFAETSDSFFARGAARSILGPDPVSIGFIDGLHVFEQALRDFIGLEALCDERSLIVFHDTLPLDEATRTRTRHTEFWTGDVWKVVPCLKRCRPDLEIFTIPTAPSGLTVVKNLDPSSGVLAHVFDEAVAFFKEYACADPVSELNIVASDWDGVVSRLRRSP